ncbi:GNAT family N-acetyltransferase [Litchfieldia alkalitelluris]|uniref:GNAT family N-acetyltransferase n=1 Tax=Litchfieldia alkalitelluris TaxID=304268 RepID=UPI0009984C5C|nr:GNAT family N-acetyltransferase [Litchfieldia alkalitelluris]
MNTKRCLLNVLDKKNYEDIRNLYTNTEVRKYLGGTRDDNTIKDHFLNILQSKADSYYWAVNEKAMKEFIGLVSLNPHHNGESVEISYQFLPKWWGKGYGKEVVNKIIEFAFEKLNLSELVAETQAANVASRKLLESVGMKPHQTVKRFGAEQVIYIIYKN